MGKLPHPVEYQEEHLDDIKKAIEDARFGAEALAVVKYGDLDPADTCGFAWVSLTPDFKGNTKIGKRERKVFEALGARKDWTERRWQIWCPTNTQSINIKELVCDHICEHLRPFGFTAHTGSNVD
tara:strand:- start:956 stop:1330 length:375 start_codon:yes stop_codon:yes gene_type:complete